MTHKRHIAVIALILLLLSAYLLFGLNSLVVTNDSDTIMEDVLIYKPRERSKDIVLWEGSIPAKGKKRLMYIPGGHSDDTIIVQASWEGTKVDKQATYPGIGNGRFRFSFQSNGNFNAEVDAGWFVLKENSTQRF